jgi:hypothetical protein
MLFQNLTPAFCCDIFLLKTVMFNPSIFHIYNNDVDSFFFSNTCIVRTFSFYLILTFLSVSYCTKEKKILSRSFKILSYQTKNCFPCNDDHFDLKHVWVFKYFFLPKTTFTCKNVLQCVRETSRWYTSHTHCQNNFSLL